MCYKILLIIFLCVQYRPAHATALNNSSDVRIYFDKKLESIKKVKTLPEKIFYLKEIKSFIYPEIETRTKQLELMYRKSVEIHNTKLEKPSKELDTNYQNLKEKIELELDVVETLNNYELAIKNTFTVFLDDKKNEKLNCESIVSIIESLYVSNTEQTQSLPSYAATVISISEDLCSVEKID